jgi:bacteriocin-like protein
MSNEIKRSTLAIGEIEIAAAAAVKRAVEARVKSGIELTDEQLNSVSGGASFYLKDPFIYGILVNPYWLKAGGGLAVNPVQVGTKAFGG